ncbi:zinc finger protein 358-like isoform X12 [Bombus flavifrons]|uniref:zinc finger protein 358-like isoform X12 n=1 Tax=Bombus flavifrons TaxID=103934 RepID=UPI003703C46B
MSSLDYLDLCRLCLVKDRVSVPIFEGEGDVRQIFLKIAACLPVKLTREDKLPKKICDDCVYKVELFYQFWNTTANAEKQLLQWLGEVSLEDKQGYVTNVLNTSVMKQEQNSENRLDGNVMQQVGEHQNNMGMAMMDNMGLGIPMMISSANQQQITSVPMDTSSNTVQTVQAVPGPSSQTTHNQIPQNQTSTTQQEDEEESSEDDENSDEDCDGDEGLPVKEESEEDPSNRTIEPTTFVNVSLACDEAGPSGLQQQKIADMPEMPIPQPTDGDPKSGSPALDPLNGSDTNPLEEPCFIKIENSYSLAKTERRRQRERIRRMNLKIRTVTSVGCTTKKLKIEPSRTNKIEARISKKQTEPLLECDFCGKQFNRKSFLASHMKQHRHRCKTCNQTFGLRKDLKQHSEQVHGPVLYPCSICEYKSNNRWTLKDHFIRKHTSRFDYSCAVCGKQFKIKNDMVQHAKQMHSNASPIICTVCGHACKSVPSLKSHMKYKHYKTAYQCNLCKRCMTTQKNLEQHLLWHKRKEKVVCQTCGKTFGQKRDLDLHLRIHEGIRPFSCPVCGKKFPRRTAQEQHILIHTGQRPYTCDICGQKFAQKPGLICHRKRHPGPLPQLPVISVRKIIADFTQGLNDAAMEKKEN